MSVEDKSKEKKQSNVSETAPEEKAVAYPT